MKLEEVLADKWATVTPYKGDVTMMNIADIMRKLDASDKRLMQGIAVEDANYIKNLASSLRQSGFKRPIWLKPGEHKNSIHVSDGIHRLIAAKIADITEIPTIDEPVRNFSS